MSPQVRLAALRAAARTALLGSLGCACGQKAPTPAVGARADATPAVGARADATPAVVPCAEHLAALKVVERLELAPGDPLRDKTDVYGAFANVAARNSARTKECCTEQLERDHSGASQRWACCSAIGGAPAGCTPWGPPCPPPMVSRRC